MFRLLQSVKLYFTLLNKTYTITLLCNEIIPFQGGGEGGEGGENKKENSYV